MTAAAATSSIVASVRRPVRRAAPASPPAPRIFCYVYNTIHRRDGTIREKKRCDSMPVYRVFTPVPLDMCNAHFNEYFESHEIEVDMVMRLSDNEDDFVPGNYKASRFNKRDRGDSDPDEREPICQVPKRRK